MTSRHLVGLLASVAIGSLNIAPQANAAGSFSTLPVVGQPSFCASWIGSPTGQATATGTGGGTGSGAVCGQTVPAGPPALTGDMIVPADVPANAATGAPPQTVTLPASLFTGSAVNRLQGGDFTTNLWQRGTTFTAISPTTYQMTADRWFAISASNVMTITKQSPSITSANYVGDGIYSSMRVARPSGTPAGSSCVGQVLDKLASAPLLGRNAVLSFYGYAPATFSAANQSVQVSIAYYTATDNATPGTNTATFALSASGQASGIAGYTAATAGQGLNGLTGSLASGVETIPLTTTPTRYSVYAPIPTTTAGTQIIGVGVSFCATPTLTTTVSTDYFELAGVQLEARTGASANPSAQFSAGVVSPRSFELLAPADEATHELYYTKVLAENSGSTPPIFDIPVLCSASGAAKITLQFPVTMREAPAFTLTAAGGFDIQTAVAQTAIGTTTLVGATPQYAELTSAAACTSTLPYQLVSTGTTGVMVFSAEP